MKSMDKLTTGVAYGTSAGSAGYWFLQLRLHGESNSMTQNYELIVKGIRNFENKVTVTLALRDKKRFDGEIFDLDISLDRVEGAALEFYEAAARRSIRQVFLDVAAGLCEGDELLPETRPCSEARYTIKINSSDNSITGC